MSKITKVKKMTIPIDPTMYTCVLRALDFSPKIMSAPAIINTIAFLQSVLKIFIDYGFLLLVTPRKTVCRLIARHSRRFH